ncbi:unnamed protein product [Meloidogyne enterolobii]|uniref:Uncharacterized protein n=1 Tax=Meloidogyne enterolobii TaxID=390850 RepID=A0ACB1B1D7_MELEN
MLFLLFMIFLFSPLFNGMDQNNHWNACCSSCWNGFVENICPQNCWDIHLGECINICWNNFCNYCNSFFGNQNANQSDDHYEEEEREADHDGDGSECEVQEDNPDIEGQWEEGYEGYFHEGLPDNETEWEEMHSALQEPSTSQGQTSHYHYDEEEEECEAEYEEDETEGRVREYDNTEGVWHEMPSTSQGQTTHHYDNWDDDVSQYNPDIHIQFEGMNIGGKIL